MYTQVPDNMRVIGTRQWPVKISNALYKGKLDKKQLGKIPEDHLHVIFNTGMIPQNIEFTEEGLDG